MAKVLDGKPTDSHVETLQNDISPVKHYANTENKDLWNLAVCSSQRLQELTEASKDNESYTKNQTNSDSSVPKELTSKTSFPAKDDTNSQQLQNGTRFEVSGNLDKIPSDEEIFAFTKMFAPVSFEIFDIPSASKANPFGARTIKISQEKQMQPTTRENSNDQSPPILEKMTGCDSGGMTLETREHLETSATNGMVPDELNKNDNAWNASKRKEGCDMPKQQPRTEINTPVLTKIREINPMTIANWINSNHVPEIIRMNANDIAYTYTNPFHFASNLGYNAPSKQQEVQAIRANNTEPRDAAKLQQNINNSTSPSGSSLLRQILDYEHTTSSAPVPEVVANGQWRNNHIDGKVFAENVPVSVLAQPSSSNYCNNAYGNQKVYENFATKRSSSFTTSASSVVSPGYEINNNLVSNDELKKKKRKPETTVSTAVNKSSIQSLMQVEKEVGTSPVIVDKHENIIEIENYMQELKTADTKVKKCSILLQRVDHQMIGNNETYSENQTTKSTQAVISQGVVTQKVKSRLSPCFKPELVKSETQAGSHHYFPSRNQQSLSVSTFSTPTLVTRIDGCSELQTGMDTTKFKRPPTPPQTTPVRNKRRAGHDSADDVFSQKLKRKDRKPTEAELIAKMRMEAVAEYPNLRDLSEWMGKTFEERRLMLADAENGLLTLITTYPALKFYEIVKEEYGRLLSGVRQMKRLEDKLMKDLTIALNMEPRRTRFQVNRHPLWKETMQRWKNTPNCDLETKKILGMLCFAFHMAGNTVAGSLFKLRKKGEVPDVLQMITPTLDVCESQLFEKKTEMWIYVDAMKYLKVPNIYEGVLSIYAIYWVYNIEYSPQLKGLFEYFDAMVKNPQTSYGDDLLKYF